MCAEKYVKIFFSILTGFTLSPNTSTHVSGKPQGWEFYLFPILCDGIYCQAVKTSQEN